MRTVVVGISTTLAVARWGSWNKSAALVPTDYVDKVYRAGGLPLLLPPLPEGAQEIVAGLDALILSSGDDIDPAHYGEPRHTRTRTGPASRDLWELKLAVEAVRADIPVLGICRGLQVLNVAFGGTLIQHLPDEVSHERHLPDASGFGMHTIAVAPDSVFAPILGTTTHIATHHHQAVGTCGAGLRASGWASDGTIEAIEMPGRRFVAGIQGHPEVGHSLRLFEHLVDSSRYARLSLFT